MIDASQSQQLRNAPSDGPTASLSLPVRAPARGGRRDGAAESRVTRGPVPGWAGRAPRPGPDRAAADQRVGSASLLISTVQWRICSWRSLWSRWIMQGEAPEERTRRNRVVS